MDGGARWAAVHGVVKSRTPLSDFTFSFHVHALEKETATHSSVLAWRIPGTGEPGGLPSMGSHRVGHAAGAAAVSIQEWHLVATRMNYSSLKGQVRESLRFIASILQVTSDFQISQKFYLFLMATYMELLRFSIFCWVMLLSNNSNKYYLLFNSKKIDKT